ncbi:MAG TPA: hypothetical protein VMT81_01045 [Candidatus Paceibacterota bacterium]|nr:hypothetical protein [Candidatus Paceibacterota bacterium]
MNQAAITIGTNLPGGIPLSAGPCGWIVNFYYFALLAAGILAFGAIVYGGLKYATSAGNASRQSEGRSWIWSALIGILLLAGAYLILYTINPGLTSCSLPLLSALPQGAVNGIGGGNGSSTTGGGSGTGGRCQAPSSGPCSTAQLQGSCMGSNNAQKAGGVCNVESSGNPNAQGDKCDDGNYASIGLFQINLSANTISDPTTGQTLNCPSAFSNRYTGSNPHCTVTNQSLYQQCLAAAKNPTTNITEACLLSKSGTNWSLWGPATRKACGS